MPSFPSVQGPARQPATPPSGAAGTEARPAASSAPSSSVPLSSRSSSQAPVDRSASNSVAPRAGIAQQAAWGAQQPFSEGYYHQAVALVNAPLRERQIGITAESARSVSSNLSGVQAGSTSFTQAHMNEAMSFGADAIAHARNGDLRNAAMTGAGAVVNAVASMSAGPAMDFERERRSGDPERMAHALSTLHSNFP
ncbi:hypothetical protein [Eleftheria terrae]|uniref:hypothetical protein n=1 Tax=Eleftheria terrae TaxID=1597781 RepID=UPI00263A692C|nr:hypothetical protein [Eleftheria terrae]WKB55507.1 hypothetical protein N7L95_25870 [Eleftheria terrae]